MMLDRTVLLLGADGYIGNALTQRLLFQGYKIVAVDNFLRRQWIKQDMDSFSATPLKSMKSKTKLFNELGEFYFHQFDITKHYNKLSQIISAHKPKTIVNLAHIPSGPYSQISRIHASNTLSNNILGTNNVLWAIRTLCPTSHYVTIGTTGQYDHYSNIDIEEGYINIIHKGRKSQTMLYPRRAGSVYHSSKASCSVLIDVLARSWGLRCTDVQQSVVFWILHF